MPRSSSSLIIWIGSSPRWNSQDGGVQRIRKCRPPLDWFTEDWADAGPWPGSAGDACAPDAEANSSSSLAMVSGSGVAPPRAASRRDERQSVERKRTSAMAGVTKSCPVRNRSSSVSILWVNCPTAVKPNIPLLPLMDWAARKMRFSRSRSSGCCSRLSRPSSIVAR